MKISVLLLSVICAFWAACSSSTSSGAKYNFRTPDPEIYGGKSFNDFNVLWYNYGNRQVAYIEEIDPGKSKSDTALWSVKLSIVKSILKDYVTTHLPVSSVIKNCKC